MFLVEHAKARKLVEEDRGHDSALALKPLRPDERERLGRPLRLASGRRPKQDLWDRVGPVLRPGGTGRMRMSRVRLQSGALKLTLTWGYGNWRFADCGPVTQVVTQVVRSPVRETASCPRKLSSNVDRSWPNTPLNRSLVAAGYLFVRIEEVRSSNLLCSTSKTAGQRRSRELSPLFRFAMYSSKVQQLTISTAISVNIASRRPAQTWRVFPQRTQIEDVAGSTPVGGSRPCYTSSYTSCAVARRKTACCLTRLSSETLIPSVGRAHE
ncbi:MAG: hypothetical protein JWR83_847, partial [Aeromicrobium sp.]|nr:hypothetical protein [Aeromicrobium sp.]